MNDTNKLLVIGLVWPEPNSSAAGRRMMHLIDLFDTNGWNITFASSSTMGPYSEDLSRRGIEQVSVKINASSFDDFIRDLQPSVVIFDQFMTEEQFGWRVAEYCPRALRILDTEDLHCLRRGRKEAVHEKRKFKKEDLFRAESAKREIASILRSDLSLIISEYEMTLLQEFFEVHKSLLHYMPFKVNPIVESDIRAWPDFEQRRNFITVGNFRHAPNLDSIKYLEKDIWPLIRKQQPGAELHIYGAYPSKEAKNMHHPEDGFLVMGRVEDVKTVVKQARVCLAPLRFGAGLKGKLVEAMECGTPSVTTAVGAEGISGAMEWNGIIAETPPELSTAAVEFYSEKTLWQKAQCKGVKIINERFAKQEFNTKLLNKIKERRSTLDHHRLKNFTGAMLRHHTAAGTKYMARWIEAKNKLKDN